MKRIAAAIAVAAAVAAIVLAPVLLLADTASCSVAVTSYADSVLNSPKGEDTEFFVSSGGVPNIMFVLDSSGSMLRLPPDGASRGWGSFEASGTTTAGAGYGCTNEYANARVFNSPCGTTTLERNSYNPRAGTGFDPPDYAEAKDSSNKYCPHMVSGNQAPATDKPGFDPDFYPAFFAKTRVFRDENWSDSSASPESAADMPLFCGGYAGDRGTTCVRCMRDRGYFFDGTYRDASGDARSCGATSECANHGEGVCVKDNLEYNGGGTSGTCRLPNVYFSGNFLNFFPPKFIIARKVLKDVLMSVRKIRLGLATFNGSSGGDLISGLNPGCNMFGSPSSFDSNRSSVKNDINNTNKVSFGGMTPLAETLGNVGQYYRTSSLPWFNNTYKVAAWEEKSGNNRSVCFSCQASAVLLITDGIPNRDSTIPGTSFAANAMTAAVAGASGSYAGMGGYNITGISTADCPTCESWAELADTAVPNGSCMGNQDSGACDDSGNPSISYLPRVAWYLKNMDFRDNAEIGEDGLPFTGKQSITTYTIGLATRAAATKILQDTAEAGGGLYNGGTGGDVSDAKTLREAIMRVLEDVNTRSTSFGAASLSTLQVASTQGVLIPRFEPSRSAHWDGHLYAFDLFSEFASGTCTTADPTTSGPANGDYDCDGKCQSVFLKDADGDFIQEDSTGAFRKNVDRTKAACGNGSLCSTAKCSAASTTAARYFWDAGSKLAPVKKTVDAATGATTYVANSEFASDLEWSRRKIYTVIDDAAPRGKFTSADTLQDLRTASASTLAPYLNIKGNRFCSSLATKLVGLGDARGTTISTEIASGTYTTCAQVILDFVRGADVFNERGCSTFPGTYCTRRYQLGDVFHSSPVEVWAPLASDGWACPRGMHPQCLPSLFSGSISNPSVDGHANAYDDYSKSARYRTRKKFALVGANDGMLHAFRMERSDSRAGEEIWAFIPPDLLPKIRLLMESLHHFYVDATPMVRDVWLDGVGNHYGSGDANGIREKDEFHTVAVVGERRGGTHYFALDVTDAGDDLDGAPKFLWLYPQPNDPEELAFGETYVEFLPKPPPIGPVRIDDGATPCAGANDGQYQTGAGTTRCFKELWIALLPGGFDPQYTKGRGVHMVGVATGEEVWDFSQGGSNTASAKSADDPAWRLNFPVAATPGMMMWGKEAQFLSAAAVDGYFDTATFGDVGGQLWVARFNDPGTKDATTGKVTNWFGARAFQTGLDATTPANAVDYCGGQPFFYITSNLPLAANGLYRTLAGTGDRFNVLDPLGGVCGPNNIRACLLKGCTVKLEDSAGNAGAVYSVEPLLGTQSYRMDHPALCSGLLASGYSYSASGGGGTTCGTVTTKVDGLVISCPSANTCSGSAEETAKRVAVTCTTDSCDSASSNDQGIKIDLRNNPDKKNWFFSIQVFERSGSRTIFRTPDEAKAYDGARLTQGDLTNVNPYDTSRAVADLATPEQRGWSYYFDHGDPSTPDTVSISGASHHIYRTDERTASVSQVEYGCAFWNTLQPAVPAGAYNATSLCPVDSPCKAGRAQLSYLYGANPGTGGFCLQVGGVSTRSSMSETLVPPTIGKMVAYVGQGQVAFGLTSVRVPQGGANVQLGEVQDLVSPVEWLPVDRATHDCRHSPKTTPPANDKCR